MSSYNYKVKSKNSGVPVWAWCVGALTLFYLLLDKKVIEGSIGLPQSGNTLPTGTETTTATRGANVVLMAKSRS